MSFRHVGAGLTRIVAQWIEDPELRWRLLCRAWQKAAGGAVAAHATPLRLEEGTLVLAVDSRRWQTTLEELHGRLLDRLQQEVGQELVRGLRWESAPVRDPTDK